MQQLIYFYNQVKVYCASPGDKVPTGIAIAVFLDSAFAQAAATATKDTSIEVRAGAALAAASAPPISTLPVAAPPPQASASQAQQYAATTDPLLFVQVSTEDQKRDAHTLISAINGLPFMQGKLRALGPDPVTTKVDVTQLRCSKKSDCERAQELAAYLGQVLRQQIKVYDISAKYGAAMEKYGPRFELWIAPGPFAVVAPSETPASAPGQPPQRP